MVNGILTIPLAGRISNSSDEVNGAGYGLLGAEDGAECDGSPFVAGPENSLAATALRPFLDRAATHYSPLVLYGPHGSGKSHLAHGLAEWWRQHFPTARVVCHSASEFAQEYAAALEDRRLDAWRRGLCEAELLIIEDLGKLAGKNGAQLELLQALDALADREALVVVTARSLPTRSPGLQSALRSRLSAGLAVPLSFPGAAARRVILERLAAERRLSLSQREVHLLADELEASVPALVSAVLELGFSADTGGGIDAEAVAALARSRRREQMPSLREIASLTAKYFGLKLSDLKSPLRRQALVAGRGVAMYLARQLTDKSLGQIGEFFGGRDHTTVLHGCRRTEKLLRRDRGTRQAIVDLKKMLVLS